MTTAVPPRVVLSSLDAATLAPLVAASRSWRQVLLALGLGSHRHVRQLRAMCEQWSVPVEHLRHRSPPDGVLREVLSTSRSWADVTTGLGFAADSGSVRATVRKHAARLGLDLSHLTARPSPRPVAWRTQPDRRHLRDGGAFLVAATFAFAGHRVCWPLEPAPYDLLVDVGDRLLRVQVKTTSRQVSGSWVCSITRSEYAEVAGGKRQVCYTPADVDVFAVVDGDCAVYVIPITDVDGLTSLSLRRYVAYRVPRLPGVDAAASSSRGDRI